MGLNAMIKTKTVKSEVKSAGRALDILELLVQCPAGLNLTDVGEHLSIPLSSLHNLMNTLLVRGYLKRDEQASVYKLSSKLIQLAAVYHSQHDLVSIADPIMDGVSRATMEATSLAILQDNAVVFVHKRAAQSFLQVVNPVGTRVMAHATGLGKVMLAYLDDDELERLYPHEELVTRTAKTISGRSELKKVLEQVRNAGFAVDNEESSEGVWAIAAPIRDRNGRALAALSVAAPLSRVREEHKSKWRQVVQEAAEEISQALRLFA